MAHNILRNKTQSGASNATGAKLRKMVSKCPVCQADLNGHRYAQVASTIVGDELKARMTEFLGHAKQHEWNKLAEFREWNGNRDNLVANVISAFHPRGILIVSCDPFELYAPNEVLLQEELTAEELEAVSSLVPFGGWEYF